MADLDLQSLVSRADEPLQLDRRLHSGYHDRYARHYQFQLPRTSLLRDVSSGLKKVNAKYDLIVPKGAPDAALASSATVLPMIRLVPVSLLSLTGSYVQASNGFNHATVRKKLLYLQETSVPPSILPKLLKFFGSTAARGAFPNDEYDTQAGYDPSFIDMLCDCLELRTVAAVCNENAEDPGEVEYTSDDEFVIEKIIAEKEYDSKKYYYVKWAGSTE